MMTMRFAQPRSAVDRASKAPPVTPAVWVVLWACMTAGYMLGFIDAAAMVEDRSAMRYMMEFYKQAAARGWVSEELYLHQQQQQCHPPDPCWCDPRHTARAWFVALSRLASAAAALPAAWLSRMAGRKVALCCGNCLFLAGMTVQATAWSWQQLLAGSLLTGCGLSILLHAMWIECAEVSPPQWRASFLACLTLGRACGLWVCLVSMAAVSIGEVPNGWRAIIALGGWPALVMLLLLVWMPETPNSLIQRGRLVEGREMLTVIRGPFYDADKEVLDIWKSAGRPGHVMHSKLRLMLEHLLELLHRDNLPPFIFCCVLALFIDATSNFLQMSPALEPLLVAVFPVNVTLNGASIVGAAFVFGALLAVVAAIYLSPKTIIGSGCIISSITWLIMGMLLFYTVASDGIAGDKGPDSNGPVLGLLLIFVANVVVNAAVYALFPVIVTENQPLSTRAHAVAIAIGTDNLVRGITVALKGTLLCKVATRILFFAAAGSLFLGIFVVLLLPNSKHLPLEVLSQCWKAHWLWKHFYRKQDQAPEVLSEIDPADQREQS